jgi:hypothetical protein
VAKSTDSQRGLDSGYSSIRQWGIRVTDITVLPTSATATTAGTIQFFATDGIVLYAIDVPANMSSPIAVVFTNPRTWKTSLPQE